eukprot:jgi/Ulvmu1/7842/UM004_0072.1
MVDNNVQLYRSSALCDLLTDTLEEMCGEEKITEDLAYKVLDGFDHCCLDALSKRAESKSTLQGSLTTYNYFDNVWKFDLSDATFKLTQRAQGALAAAPKLSTGKIKVICVESTLFNNQANQ